MFATNQVLFIVPMRFWEAPEPETCCFIADEGVGEDGVTRYFYVSHDGDGQNCFLLATDVFATREEAVTEALRRKAEQEAREEAELDVLMHTIFADVRALMR